MQGENPAGEEWISISELARRRGLTRQSIHEQVEKLERRGAIQTRRHGREKRVQAAVYDRASARSGPIYRLGEAEKVLRSIEVLVGELTAKLAAIRGELAPEQQEYLDTYGEGARNMVSDETKYERSAYGT